MHLGALVPLTIMAPFDGPVVDGNAGFSASKRWWSLARPGCTAEGVPDPRRLVVNHEDVVAHVVLGASVFATDDEGDASLVLPWHLAPSIADGLGHVNRTPPDLPVQLSIARRDKTSGVVAVAKALPSAINKTSVVAKQVRAGLGTGGASSGIGAQARAHSNGPALEMSYVAGSRPIADGNAIETAPETVWHDGRKQDHVSADYDIPVVAAMKAPIDGAAAAAMSQLQGQNVAVTGAMDWPNNADVAQRFLKLFQSATLAQVNGKTMRLGRGFAYSQGPSCVRCLAASRREE